MTAASVLSFVVGFGGGLFTLGRKTMELKQFFGATVNTEVKDQTSVEFIATQPKWRDFTFYLHPNGSLNFNYFIIQLLFTYFFYS